METLSPFMTAWYPRALAALRIVTGYLFIWHGTAKHFKVPHIAMFDGLQAGSLPWIAGWLEVIGGALIILGLFTRPTAFVMSGLMAAAYFIGHATRGHFFLPILNAGELAVLYCFVFLFISVAGPGAWSLDNLMARRRVTP